jgi:hypothetical protein
MQTYHEYTKAALQQSQKSQALHESVESLDFSRLRHKYTTSSEARMPETEWDSGELEYRRFLSLKAWYPSISLVPSKLVDKVWHAHILDTRAYREDCNTVFGRFIDHFPYFGIYGKDDYKNLQNAFSKTQTLYENHFGEYPNASPLEKAAARCGGHACHVPGDCACRVAGACK